MVIYGHHCQLVTSLPHFINGISPFEHQSWSVGLFSRLAHPRQHSELSGLCSTLFTFCWRQGPVLLAKLTLNTVMLLLQALMELKSQASNSRTGVNLPFCYYIIVVLSCQVSGVHSLWVLLL